MIMITTKEIEEEELLKVKASFTRLKTSLSMDEKVQLQPGILRADCDYSLGKDTIGKFIPGGLESLKGEYAILVDGEIVRIDS